MPNLTPNYSLKKPIKSTENADIDVINSNMDILDSKLKEVSNKTDGNTTSLSNKVDKIINKGLSENDFTSTYKTKLDGIANNANNYVHPATHPAAIIIEDETHKFVTNIEKSQITTNKNSISDLKNQVEVSQMLPLNTDKILTPLTNGKNGTLLIDKIQGATKYKKADGTIVDGWESGVTLQSVGEEITNADGSKSYRVEILTKGKNLFDKNKITKNRYVSDNTGTIGSDNTGGNISDFIVIKPNTSYSIKYNVALNLWGAFFDSNKQFISGINNKKTFTSPSNAKYFVITVVDSNVDTFQLEEGAVSTPYEEYKENKTEILLKEGLVEWNNVDVNGNVEVGTGEALWNGNENWIRSVDGKNLEVSVFRVEVPNKSIHKLYDEITVFSDILPSISPAKWESNIEGIYGWSNNSIYINVLNSKVGIVAGDSDIVKVQKIKAWISKNNIKVAYKIDDSKKTYYNVNKTLNLTAFENGYLQVNSGLVNPTVTGNYPGNISGSINSLSQGMSLLKEDVENLEDGMLSTTSDVINLKSSKQDKITYSTTIPTTLNVGEVRFVYEV